MSLLLHTQTILKKAGGRFPNKLGQLLLFNIAISACTGGGMVSDQVQAQVMAEEMVADEATSNDMDGGWRGGR